MRSALRSRTRRLPDTGGAHRPHEEKRRLRGYVLGAAILLTLLIGMSRIYLGVHWPTDVLAGWRLGAAWALLCWSIATWLTRDRAPRVDG